MSYGRQEPCVHCGTENADRGNWISRCGACMEVVCLRCWMKYHLRPHTRIIVDGVA